MAVFASGAITISNLGTVRLAAPSCGLIVPAASGRARFCQQILQPPFDFSWAKAQSEESTCCPLLADLYNKKKVFAIKYNTGRHSSARMMGCEKLTH
jgi:hypothetical protein